MKPTRAWVWLLGSYALLVAIGLMVRPLLPVDETRYVTVAWEMWSRGEYLVPHLNGLPYDHKPPLLFWLIQAGWWLLGIGDTWPRLIGPLLAVLNLVLLARLAGRLWPDRLPVRTLAPVVFVGMWYVALYSTGLMFDMLLLAFVLGAWIALWDAARWRRPRHWLVFGLCLGFGMLAKGPVALVYVLPLAWSAPWWSPALSRRGTRARWYLDVAFATALAAAVPLTWLASMAPGADAAFLGQVVWDQTARRVTGEMGHGRPLWWYLPLIPILLLPWSAWPPVWRAVRDWRLAPTEPGTRFAVTGAVTSFAILCLVGGKQVHYLVPVLALVAAWIARRLVDQLRAPCTFDDLSIAALMSPLPVLLALYYATHGSAGIPAWVGTISIPLMLLPALIGLALIVRQNRGIVAATIGTGVAGISYAALTLLAVMGAARPYYDLERTAAYLGERQRDGRPIAFLGARYQGEFGFLGRLNRPITVVHEGNVGEWIASHPDGLVVLRHKRLSKLSGATIEWSQPYKTDAMLVVATRADTAGNAGDPTGHDVTANSPAASPPRGTLAALEATRRRAPRSP